MRGVWRERLQGLGTRRGKSLAPRLPQPLAPEYPHNFRPRSIWRTSFVSRPSFFALSKLRLPIFPPLGPIYSGESWRFTRLFVLLAWPSPPWWEVPTPSGSTPRCFPCSCSITSNRWPRRKKHKSSTSWSVLAPPLAPPLPCLRCFDAYDELQWLCIFVAKTTITIYDLCHSHRNGLKRLRDPSVCATYDSLHTIFKSHILVSTIRKWQRNAFFKMQCNNGCIFIYSALHMLLD